jgi:hypothetical protein
MRGKVFEVQYRVGFSWHRASAHGTERCALTRGDLLAEHNPNRKYRIVLNDNGRKSTVHIF